MGGYALDAAQPKQYNPNFIWASKFPWVDSVDYMTLEMMRNDYMDKGREEGLKEGRRKESERYNRLISFLVRDKNYDAFERMTKDDAYKQELFKHYGL